MPGRAALPAGHPAAGTAPRDRDGLLDPMDARIRWIAEQSLRGTPEAALVTALVADGTEAGLARTLVAEVVGSPILAGARSVVAGGAALALAVRLQRTFDLDPVEVRTALDDDALYRDHWRPGRPVVLRGAASGWPASRWTFADLLARFRWAPMDVLVRRSAGWWLRDREIRRMSFGDLVATALGPPSDGLYADGRTDVLEQAGLAPMRADLGLLPGLVGDGNPRAWIGPAGTVTPTHHDQSSAWQVQLVGRKRTFLASPFEAALAATTVGLYNTADPRDPPGDVRWHEIEVGPGDAVFVPVGWWHHVEALEPSVSVSFSGFAWPNEFPWYLAGA